MTTNTRPAAADTLSAVDVVALVALYRRLLDARATEVPAHVVSVYNHKVDITDEEIAEAIDTEGELAGRYESVEITLASCSDYGGSSYDRSNVRDLDGFEGVETREATLHYSGSRAWIVLGSVTDVDALTGLVETIEGLDDYPIINESTWSELESELQDEMWDAYVRLDVMADLEGMGEENGEGEHFDPRDRENDVRDAYYSHQDNEWVCEDANSATNMRHEDAVKHVGRTVFGWSIECGCWDCRKTV